MAYSIVTGLRRQGKSALLEILSKGVERAERLKGKNHQVFKLSFDARRCYDEKMIEQKLDYIHHNPVRGKWNLVNDFVDYKYSSARYYEFGEVEDIAISHYKSVNS
ncbi:MAG TPA: hypothetical protein VL943_13715 [Niabella sp.]|nr:hypothetical protein [Niabella sp.]